MTLGFLRFFNGAEQGGRILGRLASFLLHGYTDFSNTPRELAECFQTIKNAELAC